MIEEASEYAAWFDAEPSQERTRILFHTSASVATWMAIIDGFPRCVRAVAVNRTLPLEAAERLSRERDFGIRWRVGGRQDWRDAHPDLAARLRLNPDELVEYDLTPLEREVLAQGLDQWCGPARATSEVAVAMGFDSVSELLTVGPELAAKIRARQAITHRDWARALFATEIDFISTVGAGRDWAIVTGISDHDTLHTIRELQRHLVVSGLIRRVGPIDEPSPRAG